MDVDPFRHRGRRARTALRRLGLGRGAVPGSDDFELAFGLRFRLGLRFGLYWRDFAAFDGRLDDLLRGRQFDGMRGNRLG
jgi:hypothetical protein